MSHYQVLFNGSPADQAFYDIVSRLEIEENADLPDAISLQLPVAAQAGELSWVGDPRIAPYANVAVVATAAGAGPQCIFDGYVLTQKVRVPAGTAGATVDVWGQDASVLMGLTETAKEWVGLSDVDVAASIFAAYGATPSLDNAKEAAPAHTAATHTLMQRGSDIDFLRRLARRTGRWCRVFCRDQPGVRTGYFATPDLSAAPAVKIDVNDTSTGAVAVLDFAWDATRPTKVAARQASLDSKDPGGVAADTADSGLAALGERNLASFVGKQRTVVLTAAADTAELPQRAAGLLREADWFVRCEGTADVAALGQVLRVGTIVGIEGCGSQLSGRYLVTSVRHSLSAHAHTMAFVLARNALGAAAASGGGGLLP